MSRNTTCKELMQLFFATTYGMVTAERLKQQKSLEHFTLSTIKNNLSTLKRDGYLCIGLRTKGMWQNYKKPAGVRIGYGKFFPGKCYYKLKE